MTYLKMYVCTYMDPINCLCECVCGCAIKCRPIKFEHSSFNPPTMMISVPFRASLRSIGRHQSHRIIRPHVQNNIKCFSSNENDGNPLILWLVSASETPNTSPPPRILMPKIPPNTPVITVSSPEDVVQAVDNHYSLSSDCGESQQFVGGMGEEDRGVFFASSVQDPLQHHALIQDAIYTIKQSRHGVPFGVYTSGVNLPSTLPPSLSELGLSTVQVSLLASNPNDYAKATGLPQGEATKNFGQVCGYCVSVAESGFPLEVSVLQPYASSTRDLATSLGAVQVHVYQDNDE